MSDKNDGYDYFQYTKDDQTQAAVRMKNALAKVVQAQKATPGTPKLAPNVVPRAIILQQNQEIIQSQKCSPIKIVVPSAKLPMWIAPPAVIPVTRNNITNVMIPIRRQGEVTIPIKQQQ